MSSTNCYPNKAPRVDQLLDTLSSIPRRELIHYFESNSTGDTATLDAVVTHIDNRVPMTDSSELETDLYHTHLPKLKARDWIDYDSRTGEIRYYGHEDADSLLDELAGVFIE